MEMSLKSKMNTFFIKSKMNTTISSLFIYCTTHSPLISSSSLSIASSFIFEHSQSTRLFNTFFSSFMKRPKLYFYQNKFSYLLSNAIYISSLIFKNNTYFVPQKMVDTPPLHIIGCVFYCINSYESDGGGISIDLSSSSIANCDFKMTDSGFYKCSSSHRCGAADIISPNSLLSGNCFSNCYSDSIQSLSLKASIGESLFAMNFTSIFSCAPSRSDGNQYSLHIQSISQYSGINNFNSSHCCLRKDTAGIGFMYAPMVKMQYVEFASSISQSLITNVGANNSTFCKMIVYNNTVIGDVVGTLIDVAIGTLDVTDSIFIANNKLSFQAKFWAELTLHNCYFSNEIEEFGMDGKLITLNNHVDENIKTTHLEILETHQCWDGFKHETLNRFEKISLRYLTTVTYGLSFIGVVILFMLLKRIYFFGLKRRKLRRLELEEIEQNTRFSRKSLHINGDNDIDYDIV
ncbi:hypothetical protein TRFO_34567 [Tritrichomonas foetus]|uniref:Uncharacterized protein n=1 Tax=Tritrichomonas foetus TaxID=1144522 RepID=A0A1J4JKD9_9EUKA|nr:hypothetical protein TRFO_34567 [Tritrichomonas foetus]|eukprot:OHS99081.1 hypothetical protein TRFO_34567 [Tritrichomonas foetus]